MQIVLDPNSIADYRTFLKAKTIPMFRCRGREISFPDEYAHLLGIGKTNGHKTKAYQPVAGMFDYQRDITGLAIRKRKFAFFEDCGLGKTIQLLDFAKHVAEELPKKKQILIVSPLMVIKQTMQEAKRWFGDSLEVEQVKAANLSAWLRGKRESRIGITNYESLQDDTPQGNLGCLIADESSCLKGHYGKWGQVLIRIGSGVPFKLCCTGTPAPNDRIEYANHAVFLDSFPTVNAFLARYFVNRGQTGERWELKPHALTAFYRELSAWSIFLTNPATYGWKDNCESIPPIEVHIHELDLTKGQRSAVHEMTGSLFVDGAGGITKRAKLAQLGKGYHGDKNVGSVKPQFIKDLIESWPNESTILWCWYNREQAELEKIFPHAASICGDTPHEDRERLVDEFKSGERKIMISKPKVLGFGLNLQVATRQVFSSLIDSYESYYQAVKRSNRYGSTKPLNVHLPVSEIERPMIESVLRKARRVQADTEEQERIFKEHGYHGFGL